MQPWEIITIDFIGPLPESNRYNMIIVVINQFTKKGIFILVHNSITAMGMAKEFQDHVFKEHRIPKKAINDRGPQFVANFIK